jgi:N-acyl-D-amino-acid deacylase
MRKVCLFLLLLGCVGTIAAAERFDVVIRNGRIVDGASNPAVFADLAIRDGRIAAIGDHLEGKGNSEIDARGMIVAPGFIDVHTHADELAEIPRAENFVRMGV